ncbi:hypothetical protein V8E53_014471 [Lactarius tabidus]
MDANSNHAEHEYEENPWMLVFDRIYSHHLLWPEVPARSSAIALWMERLVQFENNLLDMTGLSASTEEEIDTWCALRGFPRAEIRVRIQPFADSTWVERFPLYARALQGELAMYDKVVGDAMARQGGNRDTLDALEQASAFTAAANEFSARCARGRLTATVRLRFSYRLAMDQARLSDPQVETYELRPIESSAYLVRAPLPERHDLARAISVSSDDSEPPRVMLMAEGIPVEVGVDVVVVAVVRGADMDMGERRVRSIRQALPSSQTPAARYLLFQSLPQSQDPSPTSHEVEMGEAGVLLRAAVTRAVDSATEVLICAYFINARIPVIFFTSVSTESSVSLKLKAWAISSEEILGSLQNLSICKAEVRSKQHPGRPQTL